MNMKAQQLPHPPIGQFQHLAHPDNGKQFSAPQRPGQSNSQMQGNAFPSQGQPQHFTQQQLQHQQWTSQQQSAQQNQSHHLQNQAHPANFQMNMQMPGQPPSQQFQQNQIQQINGGFQQPPQQNFLNDDGGDQSDIIGVIKIKDGIFICDEFGAQDLEFVVANKVTRVVNTAGTQLPNHWEPIGVLYLTLNWQDDEKQTLFDSQEKIPEEIYKFMEEAINNQESVLIQSVKAQNRACFVIASFVMRRYRWSLLKTLEFLNSRRPDLEMRPSFLSQLSQYENRLYQRGIGPKTQRWTELSDNTIHLENEELILRNTYLNSQMAPLDDLSRVNIDEPRIVSMKWTDEAGVRPLQEEGRDEDDLVNLVNPPPIRHHREQRQTQSIIKGSRQNLKMANAPKSKFLAKTSGMQAIGTKHDYSQPQPPINFHPQQQNQQENLVVFNQPQPKYSHPSTQLAHGQPFQDQSNFLNYQQQVSSSLEPKKMQLSSKLPPKNTLPNDDKSAGTVNHSMISQANDSQQIQHDSYQQPTNGAPQQRQPFQHQTLLNSQQKTRGLSPSIQSKNSTQDSLGKRSMFSAESGDAHKSMAMQKQNAHPVPNSHQQRPGSVPCKRPQTPTQPVGNTGSSQQNSNSNSFIMKQNTQQSVPVKSDPHQQPSKNMLNSFRNGPIKIVSSNLPSKAENVQKQPITTTLSQTKPGPNKNGGIRPSSAPAKRPSSPSQNPLLSNTTQQRTKYTGGQVNSTVTRSAVFKHAQVLSSGNTSQQAPPNGQVKPGLNPTLRGYSPSKLRWKQGNGPQPSTNSNPNTFMRSTKHVPSMKA